MHPGDVLRKKRQRGGDALPAAGGEGGDAPLSPRSDAGASDVGSTSSGISWRSGSTGSSLPHLGSMAAADILDSYMRELLHNTLPCLGEWVCGLGRPPRPHPRRRGGAERLAFAG